MPLFIALFFACSDPAAPALAACDVVPMVSMDAGGLTALEPHLDPAELDIIRSSPETMGFKKLGGGGVEALRGKANCTVKGTESKKEGTLVKLERSAPTVKPDGSFGDNETVELEYLVVSTDAGMRAQVGMTKAADLRKQIDQATAEGNLKRVAELYQSLMNTTHDPALAIDLDYAQKQQAKQYMLANIVAKFDRPKKAEKDGEVNMAVGKVTNGTQRGIQDAVVVFTFDMGDEKTKDEKVNSGPVGPSETKEIMVAIPLETKGAKVEVKLEDVTL